MGEIILSVCIGGFLVISGIVMIVVLNKEEKKFLDEQKEGDKR